MKQESLPKLREKAFQTLALAAVVLPLSVLLVLLLSVFWQGLARLEWSFLTSFPSRIPGKAGILSAIVSTFFLMILTAIIALPLGVGAATYLEEYGKEGRVSRLIEVNIANLAGVPSVIYGLLGLEIFVRVFALGNSLIAGAATLSLLILPIVITSAREAIRTVPKSLREASMALGGSNLSTIVYVVWPMALPGILTGAILSLSRAIGETAPIIVIGAATYMAFVPNGLFSDFTALPLQIFNWVTRPQQGFSINAAAAIVFFLMVLLIMNGLAIFVRNRMQQRALS